MAKENNADLFGQTINKKKSLSTMLPLIGMQKTIPSNLFYAYLQRNPESFAGR